ncbi:MAG: twin-arginine translocase TatA/TatE family subunit [Acidobacteriota bacterium]
MGPLGWQETVFIFILALLVFGPKKLPELGKTIGKALTEFRRASSDLKATFDREMSSLEREGESLKEVTSSYQQEISGHDYEYNYDSSYGDGGSESSASGGNGEGSAPADSAAASPSTTSASATEGAESEPGAAPEGAVASSEPAVAGLAQPADEKPAVEA